MAETPLLKIISEKFIKPSSPTPPSSKYYKFSFFDVYVGDTITPVAFFYPKRSFHGRDSDSSSRSKLFDILETSLSKTLTYYYPFAGRFMDDNITVDCNDDGVQLWEVQIQASMSEILDNRADYQPWNSVFLEEVFRCGISHVKVQLSCFECGGICVIISFSHKLGDGITMANFVNDWSMMARGCGSEEVLVQAPDLSLASIFPPPNDANNNNRFMEERSSDLVTQRFVFSSSSIRELKKMVAREVEIKNPTQAEVVTTLIFKSVMSAAARLNSLSFKPSSLIQIVNFRSLTIPPLSEKMVGNLVNRFVIAVTEEEKEMTFSRMVTELRKSKLEYLEAHKARLEGNEFLDKLSRFWHEDEKKLKSNNNNNSRFEMYTSTSCFRFPFYDADFGFGKPIFVCQPGGLFERTILLMGTPRGDEIDAFITLKRDQMFILEHEEEGEELLAFASLNPKICVEN